MFTDAKKTNEQAQVVSPPVNIRETDAEVVLEAEMSGLQKDDIAVELAHNELTVTGKKKPEAAPKEYRLIHQERYPLEYRRTFVLGSEVSKENISAQYENGILTLRIPKSEEKQPRKITIA
jgi:HSP20 family protein